MSTQATIVVGVDGSDCSRTALEFALNEAALRGVVLGSVGLQCVLHAAVPVTVVRPVPEAATA